MCIAFTICRCFAISCQFGLDVQMELHRRHEAMREAIIKKPVKVGNLSQLGGSPLENVYGQILIFKCPPPPPPPQKKVLKLQN